MPHLRTPRFVALAATAVLAAGCASSGQSASDGDDPLPELERGQRVSITWETYNLLSDDAGSEAVEELVRRFEAEHPNIDVTAKAPQGDVDDNVASVQRQAVAGDPPDVAQLTFDGLRYYADGLGARPVDDVVGRRAVDEHLLGGPTPYHPRAARLADVDGRHVGLPYIFSTPVYYYNADLFERAGLDPDDPPRTGTEVRAAADAVARRTDAGGGYVLCVAAGVGDWCLQSILRSNGGRVLAPDGSRVAFGDPPATQAVGMLKDLHESGEDTFPDATWEDASERFQRGELGFFLSTSAIQGSLIESAEDNDFELRAAPMPGFGERPPVPTNSGAGLFMFAQEPAEQRAAWELMRFLTGPEAQALITEEVGYLPLRAGLVDDPRYLKAFADAQRGLIEPNLGQLDRLEATASFPGPSFAQITTLMMDAVDESVFRGADPAAALGEAQRRADELVARG